MLISASSLMAMPVHHDSLTLHQAEFVQNLGQWNSEVLFRTRLHGGAFFTEQNGFTIAMVDPEALNAFAEAKLDCNIPVNPIMTAAAYRVSFLNAAKDVKVTGLEKLPYHHNYFTGHDSKNWRSNVPVFSSVFYQNLYDGVDMKLYQSGENFEYEFHIHPFVDPNVIQWQYDGAKSVSLSSQCLVIKTDISRVLEMQPFAYQIDKNGDTITVDCKYLLRGNKASFKLGSYDKSRPLVIDPVLVFSSYTGSTADNWGYTATYDAAGNLYGGGIAFGVGYPALPGSYQIDYCSGQDDMSTDVVISKFDSSGAFLHYSTYLGGDKVDIPHSLFVNDNDELYVFGTTGSANFPVTPDAFDTTFNGGQNVTLSTALHFPNGSDIFVSKFSADGSQLLGSTFVGGSGNDGINTAEGLRKNYADDNRGEILVDDYSNVYVVTSTQSMDFPVTSNAYNTSGMPQQDVCVFKLSQDLSQMIWGSYFGGSDDDAGYSMMLCQDGSLYICGGTKSLDLPTTSTAYQPEHGGGVDGFVAHFSENGDQLLNCTYTGSPEYDQAYLIKGDYQDYPHIFGQTAAIGNHWIVNAPYNVPNGGQFLTKLTPDLDTVVWSTAFGTGNGGPDISPTALLVDYCSNIYMSGWGSHPLNGFGGTNGLPVTSDAFQTTTDGSDYYFICLSDDASQLVFASYFGGDHPYAREHVDGGTSRFDRKGRIYQAVCAGCGGQSTFPTTPGAFSEQNGSFNCNLGVVKIDFGLPVVVADFNIPNTICAPEELSFENNSQTIDENTSYFWDFGDGETSTLENPTHLYTESGVYMITLAVTNVGSCNFSDTLRKQLLVLSNSIDTLPTLSICHGDFVQIGVIPNAAADYLWQTDQLEQSVDNDHISNPVVSPTESTTYQLIMSAGECTDTLIQHVEVYYVQVLTSNDTTICYGDTAHLHAYPDEGSEYNLIEWSLNSDFTNLLNNHTLNINVNPESTTTYYVRLSGNGCSSMAGITVTVDHLEITNTPVIPICFGDSTALWIEHNGEASCQYHWNVAGVGEFDVENPVVLPSAPTTYFVTVTNSRGCKAAANGTIVVQDGTFEPPLAAWCDDCSIWQFHTAVIHATDYGNDYTYHWTPDSTAAHPNHPSTKVTPPESTMYTVTVTDTFGCTMTDSVFIKVDSVVCGEPFVFIPTAFSPNGDGLNDILYVRSEILLDFHFVVYNHWGEKVFETTDLSTGWDGTFKGVPCQQDVYDYHLTGRCMNEEAIEIKGNVTLLR